MVRKVNTAFVGGEQREVDVDAPVYRATLENAAGDTALAQDLLYGTNSPPANSTIDHSGKHAVSGLYRGVPLGIPIGQQMLAVSQNHRRHLRDGAGTQDAWAFLVPCYIPRGETRLATRVHDANTHYEHRAFAFNTSYVELDQRVASPPTGSPNSKDLSAILFDLNPGVVNLVGLRTDYSPSSEARVFHGPRLYFNRIANPNYRPLVSPTMGDKPYGLATQVTAGATHPNYPSLDSSMFAVPYPVHGYMTDRLARQQNTLTEALTGAPANGNLDYTLAPDQLTAPVRSAFLDHSISAEKTSEPHVGLPLWMESFGGCGLDGLPITTTPGDDTWAARGLKTIATWFTFLNNTWIYIPNLPNGASSQLTLVILAADSNMGWAGALTAVTCRATFHDAAGSAKASTTGTFAACGVAGDARKFALASAFDIDFFPDVCNRLKLEFNASALNKVDGTAFVPLGACLYWDAP